MMRPNSFLPQLYLIVSVVSMASWQRFYLGYQGRFQDDVALSLPCGATVVVAQAPSASSEKKKKGKGNESRLHDPSLTGTTVWDGAVCLAFTLAASPSLLAIHDEGRKPSLLELGAGCGLVSLALAAEGLVSQACITDINEMLPSIEGQLRKNETVLRESKSQPATLTVRAVKWGPEGEGDIALIEREDLASYRSLTEEGGAEDQGINEQSLPPQPPVYFDLIVGSDLIYYSYSEETPHTRLLLWTLKRLAGPDTLIYMALSLHHNPEEVQSFLTLASEEGFTVDRIIDEVPMDYRVEDVIIVRLRKH